MEKELMLEDSYELSHNGYGIHTWEENGNRMIAVAHAGEPRFTLLKWDGTSLSEEATYLFPATVNAVHTWEENGNRMIATAHRDEPYFTLLKWDGTNLSEAATYLLPGEGAEGYSVHTWEENGNRMIAVGLEIEGEEDEPRFVLLKWDGTNLSEADTWDLPGTDVGNEGAALAVHTWEENGNRMIAVGHRQAPGSVLLKWDGTSLSDTEQDVPIGTANDFDSWEENGNRWIAAAHFGEPFFTLLKWDGTSMSEEATYLLPSYAYAVHTWEENGNRMIAVGHARHFYDEDPVPYFTLLKWDGTNLSEADTWPPLPNACYAVHTWEENGDRLIALGHLISPYFTLLRWGTIPPSLSVEQIGDNIRATIEEGVE